MMANAQLSPQVAPQETFRGEFDGANLESQLSAQQLAAAGLINSPLNLEGAPNPAESVASVPQKSETIGLKESLSIFARAPQEAGEQIGLSGIIFDSVQVNREKDIAAKQAEIQSQIQTRTVDSAPANLGTTQFNLAEQQYQRSRAAAIEQQRAQLNLDAAKVKVTPEGQSRLVIKKARVLDLSEEDLIKKARFGILSVFKRQQALDAYRMNQQRQAKKQVNLLDGGKEQQADSIAQMSHSEAAVSRDAVEPQELSLDE